MRDSENKVSERRFQVDERKSFYASHSCYRKFTIVAVVDAIRRLSSFALVSTIVDKYICIVELVDKVSKKSKGVRTQISEKPKL